MIAFRVPNLQAYDSFMTFPSEKLLLYKSSENSKLEEKGELQEGQVKTGASPHETTLTLRGHFRGSSVPAADRHLHALQSEKVV